MALPEQLEPRSRGMYRKWCKRVMKRKIRRDGKRLMEDAPKKNRYRGWEL